MEKSVVAGNHWIQKHKIKQGSRLLKELKYPTDFCSMGKKIFIKKFGNMNMNFDIRKENDLFSWFIVTLPGYHQQDTMELQTDKNDS